MKARTATLLLACLSALMSALPAGLVSPAGRAAAPPVIREAPPAPTFTDDERHAELRSRRARVMEKLGPNSLLVLFSAVPRVYTNDVDYEFRQENNLYYLTALRQEGATLVMLRGAAGPAREILFLRRRNPAAETWTGRMYSPEEARAASGLGEIWDAREFETFMKAVRSRLAYRPAPEAVLLSPPDAPPAPPADFLAAMSKNEATLYLLLTGGEHNQEFRREHAYSVAWAGDSGGLGVRSAWDVFAEMRMRKSPYELRLMQHAVDISIEGHQRAQAVASRAKWEYEVEAELDYTYRRRNADNWGYPSIVGCGPNATTLHYQESQGRVGPGDLLLMDAGAEYEHYSADVTRTFPVSGRFTPAQAEIYNVVLAAQEAAFRAIRPGARLSDVHDAAAEVIKDGLLRLGLITDRDSVAQNHVWFMHGTSHWLGMNVHDVSPRGFEKLDAGMVFTVEPGIYVRPDALDNLPKTPESEKFAAAVRPAFEKYKGIGVRVEDDVVVTADGYRNLSVALPRTVGDIEAFIARAQKEVRVGFLPPWRWDAGE
ncbi:MAG TPA: aminopeptidase P family protein [Pyrinomonadaceae bacterium]